MKTMLHASRVLLAAIAAAATFLAASPMARAADLPRDMIWKQKWRHLVTESKNMKDFTSLLHEGGKTFWEFRRDGSIVSAGTKEGLLKAEAIGRYKFTTGEEIILTMANGKVLSGTMKFSGSSILTMTYAGSNKTSSATEKWESFR